MTKARQGCKKVNVTIEMMVERGSGAMVMQGLILVYPVMTFHHFTLKFISCNKD